ncbi:MAG: serpin family protein [Bacteroidaceae bacterium]|nr:serpin family protein [Bacteroidaceae bacterium]
MKNLFCFIIGLLLVISCSNESKITNENNNTQQSSLNGSESNGKDSSYVFIVPKQRTDIGLTSLEAEIIESVKAFDVEYATTALASANKNVVISPLGMNILLSMLVNGADNSTLEELMNALNCDRFSPDSLAAFMGNLCAQLADVDNSTTFKTANSVWVQAGFPVLDNFVAINRRFLQADISNIDFASDTASKVINDWCKRSTEGLIERLDTEINKDWVMLLANALYFKGQWESMFSTNQTVDGDFTDSEGNNRKVKFMEQTNNYRYLKNDSYQIVELPYGNKAYSMFVAIPEQDKTVMDCAGAVIRNLDGIVNQMRSTLISLSLPRFEAEYSLDARQTLSSIGISQIFDSQNADFGRMTPIDIYVNLIKQQSVIKVTESGTEAAAVTYAGMAMSAGEDYEPPTPLVVKVNKPFLYVIRETSTGTILFAGKVNSIQ